MPGAESSVAMRTLSRRILEENLRVKRGENVTIETWSATAPWASAMWLAALELNAHPMVIYVDEPTFWTALEQGRAPALGRVGSHEWAALRETDAYVAFYGPNDTTREDEIPSETYRQMTAYENEWFRIIEKARVRAVRLEFGRINAAAAKRFHLDEEEWRREMIEAISVDADRMHRDGLSVGNALRRGKQVHISHPNGTHLELRLKGRRPRIHDGVVDQKDEREGEIFEPLPAGWVAVAPDEHFAEGEFIANVPNSAGAAGMDAGPSVPTKGGRWSFRDGKLVDFSYETGGEAFAKVFRSLGAGKERPGAMNIGLNPKIRALPGMEDQTRGRVTLMVGRNSHLDGATQTPYFHGYLVLDGGDVQVDGKWIVRAGEIV